MNETQRICCDDKNVHPVIEMNILAPQKEKYKNIYMSTCCPNINTVFLASDAG